MPKTAAANEIKKKYFTLAKTMHPDKGGDAEKVFFFFFLERIVNFNKNFNSLRNSQLPMKF